MFPRENNTDSCATRSTTSLYSATSKVDKVLIARGEITTSSTTATVSAETASAIERAFKALTDISLLISQQNTDPFLRQIRDSLAGGQTRPENDRYLIDEREQVWYTPDSNKPVLTVPYSMVSELFVLVYTLHRHAGVGAALALMRDRFHWPANARDKHLHVSSCRCNRRKRSRSQESLRCQDVPWNRGKP